jgi:hypothetical protein
MAPQVLGTPRDPAHRTWRFTVDEPTISPVGDPFHAAPEDQNHPHACLNGYVYLGYTAHDEETGEEVERVEALPCRRCAEEAR